MAFANPAYQRLFDLLLQDDGNLYFHCTAGKDRTGVAGFLIMMALGVEEEDAIQEYLLSNTYLKQGDDEFAMLLNSSEEKKQLFVPLLGVQEEFIRLTIRSIKEAYTSYDEFFLREYKLDQEKRNRLAELYCE
ncbi:MAG: tyrosine-protein phosphatase [Lachnospiraceae bacterium]|jgi:protein-tyrosine phosphatase|nr:tyrosine-protein phosphatase [Lachnospiraceae bacterium]